MRIIVKAKPIRIRIKSGGEEHSSLDSLRQNLCVQDLWPLVKDKRLSRWLMQLGEVDLAHAIDALSVGQLDFPTYFKVLVIFLKVKVGMCSVNSKKKKTRISCLNKENLHLRDLLKVMGVTSTKTLCLAKN